MDLLKLPSSQNHLFVSDNLCILAFNTRVTQFFDLSAVRIIDDGHERGKSLILVVGDESLS